MSTITELQVIFQKPVDESEVPNIQELVESKVFATQGQTEVYRYIRTATDYYVENCLQVIPCSIPTGVAGMTQAVKVAVWRLMKTTDTWDNAWVQFYVIAKFESLKNGQQTEFFRTIMPRTEIPMGVRNLRHRNKGNRKPRSKSRRRVRR